MHRSLIVTASLVSVSLASMASAQTASAPLVPAAVAPTPADSLPSATIRFVFETGAATGRLMVALYDSAATYDGGAPVRAARIDVTSDRPETVFADLPAGTYAMKAFHDLDGNGQMNTNPFGMPSEPFAFSNNARGNMGPASWERSRFELPAAVSAPLVQTITIR